MKFIVLEGLDGSGKSTQIKMLLQHLKSMSISHEYIHFPRTDKPFFGEMVARFLRGEFGDNNSVDPYLVALLYAGDRYGAAETIKRWLNEGKLVLVDRYVYSNIAYQCAKIENDFDQENLKKWILELEFDYFKIPQPDINIFFDVPLEFVKKNLNNSRTGYDRDYLKGMDDIHEKDFSFQIKVRNVYLKLADDGIIKKIECFKNNDILPPDVIFNELIKQLKLKNLI